MVFRYIRHVHIYTHTQTHTNKHTYQCAYNYIYLHRYINIYHAWGLDKYIKHFNNIIACILYIWLFLKTLIVNYFVYNIELILCSGDSGGRGGRCSSSAQPRWSKESHLAIASTIVHNLNDTVVQQLSTIKKIASNFIYFGISLKNVSQSFD